MNRKLPDVKCLICGTTRVVCPICGGNRTVANTGKSEVCTTSDNQKIYKQRYLCINCGTQSIDSNDELNKKVKTTFTIYFKVVKCCIKCGESAHLRNANYCQNDKCHSIVDVIDDYMYVYASDIDWENLYDKKTTDKPTKAKLKKMCKELNWEKVKWRKLSCKEHTGDNWRDFMNNKPVLCPSCNGTIIKYGFIRCDDNTVQRYRCKECKHTFSGRNARLFKGGVL